MRAKDTAWRDDERDLVRVVALGLSNKEIAARRGVSETAIKKRLSVLMRRVGASNRPELVRSAIAGGIISVGDEYDAH